MVRYALRGPPPGAPRPSATRPRTTRGVPRPNATRPYLTLHDSRSTRARPRNRSVVPSRLRSRISANALESTRVPWRTNDPTPERSSNQGRDSSSTSVRTSMSHLDRRRVPRVLELRPRDPGYCNSMCAQKLRASAVVKASPAASLALTASGVASTRNPVQFAGSSPNAAFPQAWSR